jgi:ABC-type Fe3+-siderophore transport system permease subunit
LLPCNDPDIIKKKGDSTYVITEKEIEQAMHFGAKEKISSIVVGGLFGALIGGFTASLFQRDQWGYGNIKLALYGVSIGSLFGSIANYTIIKHLAKKSAKKRLVEKIKSNPSYEK